MNEEKEIMPIEEANESQLPDPAEQNIEPGESATEPVEGESIAQAPQEAEEVPVEPAEEPQEPETPAVQETPAQEPPLPTVVYRWDYAAQKQYDHEMRRKKEGRKSGFAFFGIVLCAFLIVIGLLIGVLAFRDSLVPQRATNTTDTVAIAEKLLPSTVLITAMTGTTGNTGSGFFVRQDGYIVTNYHVVEGKDTIRVKLYGSLEKMEATLIGFNATCDIAVLKIAGNGYPAVTFGDSSAMRVGDDAVSIGSPAGADAEWSVTKGIVSAVDRKLSVTGATEIIELHMIQTDAAVNPGSSGGLLCNSNGEVIGIIARKQIYRSIVSESGDIITIFDEGLGYAIPGNGAKAVIDGLISLKEVDLVAVGLMRSRPKIGITVVTIKKGEKLIDEQTLEAQADGVLVSTVNTNGANGLLAVGDIIVSFDGIAVTSNEQLIEMLYSYKRGDKVKIDVIKNGDYYPTYGIELTLGVFN